MAADLGDPAISQNSMNVAVVRSSKEDSAVARISDENGDDPIRSLRRSSLSAAPRFGSSSSPSPFIEGFRSSSSVVKFSLTEHNEATTESEPGSDRRNLYRQNGATGSNGSLTAKSSLNSSSVGGGTNTSAQSSGDKQSMYSARSFDKDSEDSGDSTRDTTCSKKSGNSRRHKLGKEQNRFLRYLDMYQDQNVLVQAPSDLKNKIKKENRHGSNRVGDEMEDLDCANSIDDESLGSDEIQKHKKLSLYNASTTSFESCDDALSAFIEPSEIVKAWNVLYDMIGGDDFLLVESDTMMWTWKRLGQVFDETAVAYAKKVCKAQPNPRNSKRNVNLDDSSCTDESVSSVRDTVAAFKKGVASYRGGVMEGTLLHYMCRINPPNDIFKMLVEAYPKSLLTTDKEDYQPITYVHNNLLSTLSHKNAVVRESRWDNFLDVFDTVRHTKFAKVVVTMKGGKNADTLLHQIIVEQDVPEYVLQAILGDKETANALVTRTNKHGSTPLHYAVQNQASLPTISLLIYSDKTKHTLVARGQYGYTPLHLATHKGVSLDVVKLLLHSAEDKYDLVCSVDHNNETPLAHAVQRNASYDVIKELVGADDSEESLFMKDCFGKYPLCQAIRRGLPTETIELLVEHSPVELIEALIKRTIGCEKKLDPTKRKGFVPHKFKRSSSYLQTMEVDPGSTVDVSVRYLSCLAKFVVSSPRCQDILNNRAADRVFTAVMMADFYVYVLLIVSFTISTQLCIQGWLDVDNSASGGLPWFNLLYFLSSYLCMREILQFTTQGMNWLIDIWNWLDMLNVILVAVCAATMKNGIEFEWARQLFMVTGFIVWFMLLTFLKSSFLPFSVFITGVSNIIWKLIPFLASSSIVLGAFVHMYYTDAVGSSRCMGMMVGDDNERIMNGEDSKFCTYQGSILKIFHMFVGGVDEYLISNGAVEERNWRLDDHDMNFTTMSVSILFGLLVQILLLNVIIVVVNESWDDVARHGAEVFWEHRINFLAEVRTVGLGSINSSARSGTERIMKGMDGIGMKILNFFFWGEAPQEEDTDLYEYMTSLQDDGFLRNLCTEWSDAEFERYRIAVLRSQCRVFLRGLYNFAVCSFFGALSLVGGFVTFGVLWPRDFRYYLFGRNAVDDLDGTGQMSKEIHLIRERCDTFEAHLKDSLLSNQELIRQNDDLRKRLEEANATLLSYTTAAAGESENGHAQVQQQGRIMQSQPTLRTSLTQAQHQSSTLVATTAMEMKMNLILNIVTELQDERRLASTMNGHR